MAGLAWESRESRRPSFGRARILTEDATESTQEIDLGDTWNHRVLELLGHSLPHAPTWPSPPSFAPSRQPQILQPSFFDNEWKSEDVVNGIKPPKLALHLPDEAQQGLHRNTGVSPVHGSASGSVYSDLKSVTTINDFGFAAGMERHGGDQMQRGRAQHGGDQMQRERGQSLPRHLGFLDDSLSKEFKDPQDKMHTHRTRQHPANVGNSGIPRKPVFRAAHSEGAGWLVDDDNQDPACEIGQELRAGLTESHYDKQPHKKVSKTFLPLDKLFSLLGTDQVRRLLLKVYGNRKEKQEVWDMAPMICTNAYDTSRRMILAILILIEHIDWIEHFIRGGICDIHLPLRPCYGPLSRKALFLRKDDSDSSPAQTCLEEGNCRISHLEHFCDSQYRVISPFFDMRHNHLHFYQMEHSDMVLPFEEWVRQSKGGYGTVWKVRIHPAHHNFVCLTDLNPHFAVKEIRPQTDDEVAFLDEVRVLERFSGPNSGHSHLIRLLLTFQHRGKYYLVFPWADGNLADLWRSEQLFDSSERDVMWLMDQCLGIADGLKKIHNHKSWPLQPGVTNDGLQSPNFHKTLGRHGDIKPENILIFKLPSSARRKNCNLVISDFGLSQFHSPNSVSNDAPKGLSKTYRPPEYDAEQQISQPWDMWSLGCVYLQFVSWFLLGYDEGHVDFQNARVQEEEDLSLQEDKFFRISPGHDPEVKLSVKKWVEKLQSLGNCPPCLQDFLALIINCLLVPDPKARIRASSLSKRLDGIKKKCDENKEYCTIDMSRSSKITPVEEYELSQTQEALFKQKLFQEVLKKRGVSSTASRQNVLKIQKIFDNQELFNAPQGRGSSDYVTNITARPHLSIEIPADSSNHTSLAHSPSSLGNHRINEDVGSQRLKDDELLLAVDDRWHGTSSVGTTQTASNRTSVDGSRFDGGVTNSASLTGDFESCCRLSVDTLSQTKITAVCDGQALPSSLVESAAATKAKTFLTSGGLQNADGMPSLLPATLGSPLYDSEEGETVPSDRLRQFIQVWRKLEWKSLGRGIRKLTAKAKGQTVC